MGLLTGLKVLELGDHVSAPYAAANLVKLGAEVVKICDCGRMFSFGFHGKFMVDRVWV